MSHVRLGLDEEQDVLYVAFDDAESALSAESPSDGYLIINYSKDKRIVGVQVIRAHEMVPEEWKHHPDRDVLPAAILEAVDRWYAHHAKRNP